MNSLPCIFQKISPLLHEKWRRTFLSETFWTIVFHCAGSKFIIRILSMSWDWDINSKQKECDKHRLALYLELLEKREMVPKVTPVLLLFCNTLLKRCQVQILCNQRPTWNTQVIFLACWIFCRLATHKYFKAKVWRSCKLYRTFTS